MGIEVNRWWRVVAGASLVLAFCLVFAATLYLLNWGAR